MLSSCFASSVFAIVLFLHGHDFVHALGDNNASGKCGRTLDDVDNLSVNYSCFVGNCSAVVSCKSSDDFKNWTFICDANKTVWLPTNDDSAGSLPVNCTSNDARGYNNSYSRLENSACEVPQDQLANGSYNLATNGTMLTYHCLEGFILVGSQQRYCLQNKTWSGQLPYCVADVSTAETIIDALKIFARGDLWQGHYNYNGKPIAFKFSMHRTEENQLVYALRDAGAYHNSITSFNLIGVQHDNDVIFNLTHLWEDSDAFPKGVTWSVRGRLSVIDSRLTYVGKVVSSQSGFSELIMSPVSATETVPTFVPMDPIVDGESGEAPSVLAMVVGITMALVAIVFAGIMATFCVRRNGTSRQGHQSLTSFENPIYDSENVLK